MSIPNALCKQKGELLKYQLSHHPTYAQYILTPKYQQSPSILHDTTWKNHECNYWTRNNSGGWDVPISTPPDIYTPHIHHDIENVPRKAPLIGHKNPNYTITLIQSDMGANRCVTNLKHIIVGYEDIPDYPIGGVKMDAVAIVCKGKGYLTWYSSEGTCVLVEVQYSTDCEWYTHISNKYAFI